MADISSQHGAGNLFGGGPKQAGGGSSDAMLAQQVSNVATRLRVLEERSTNARKKVQLIEHNMLSNQKKIVDDIKLVHSEMDDLKHTITEVENKIILIIKEIRLLAKKEDVDTMMKYVEMWEPIHFVTQNQVEKITREIVEEVLSEKKGK